MLEGVCNTATESTMEKEETVFIDPLKGGLDRLIRVYGCVFAATYMWRKKKGSQGPVLINLIEAGKHR